MKYIKDITVSIIKKITPNNLAKPVGRWRIENCNKQLNNKIDLSNEDHCGPCGQYALVKMELQKKQIMNPELEKTKK
jgi:hypothetical protein